MDRVTVARRALGDDALDLVAGADRNCRLDDDVGEVVKSSIISAISRAASEPGACRPNRPRQSWDRTCGSPASGSRTRPHAFAAVKIALAPRAASFKLVPRSDCRRPVVEPRLVDRDAALAQSRHLALIQLNADDLTTSRPKSERQTAETSPIACADHRPDRIEPSANRRRGPRR